MFQNRARIAYTQHCIRAHLQGFEPLTWVQFQRFGLFKV